MLRSEAILRAIKDAVAAGVVKDSIHASAAMHQQSKRWFVWVIGWQLLVEERA